ncbi:MAG TPA: ATP-binding protein, partial [Labilithrix sp.]|nr:ATP-binding protein [Labilithrix sp.]
LAISDHQACIEIPLRCLRRFGIEWRAQPTWEDVRAERERLEKLLDGRTIEDLADLPPMVDPDALAVMDLLTGVKAPALITSPTLVCILGYRMVATSVAFGNGPTSGFGYTTLAMALLQYLDSWKEAYRYAKLGQQVGERLTPPAERGKIYIDFSLISAWCRPMADSYRIFEHELELTRRWGDFLFASYMYYSFIGYLLLGGVPLPEVRRAVEDGMRYTRETKFWFVEQMILGEERFLSCLEGKTTEFGRLDGDGFDETAFAAMLANNEALGIIHSWFDTWRLVARYMAGRYEEAIVLWPSAKAHVNMPLAVSVIFLRAYHALTRAALVDRASSEDERQRHLAELHEELRVLRTWAERCPENYFHHYALVAAEAARVAGDHLEAEQLYERAISAARDSSSVYVSSVALAMELAGRYYLGRGFTRIGEVYLADARDRYRRWGAAGKVAQLEALYPQIKEQRESALIPTVTARQEQLDLLSVTKASQSIAEETNLKDVICTLMRVVLEQSMARRAYLVLSDHGDPKIRAEARCTKDGIDAKLLFVPAVGSTLVPEPLVNYVWRTREQVVLADASDATRTGRVIPEDYLARYHPKSVLCRPIVRRAELVGVLYLENELVTHVFTPARVGALEVIAAQAAISLEIATAIQEERRSRAALVASEARFRRVAESNMIGILFGDLSGRILDANDYVLDMLGYSRASVEAGALRWDVITPPEYAEADKERVQAVREGRTLPPFEKEFFRSDGSRVTVLAGVAPLEEHSEEIVTFLLDVTERRRLFLQEKQARSDAERALRMREEFMAIAAHELRTPLTPLRLQLQMLKEHLSDGAGSGDPKIRHSLVKMFTSTDKQVDRLKRLVDDMLDLSKLGRGPPTLERESVDLCELVSDVVQRYRSDAEKANSPLVLQIPRTVRGSWDRARIEQVVVNLLTNAIKYGAGHPIDIVVREHGDKVSLTVQDHGIGIREEDHTRIFERFERAVSIKHFGGFGLGLYISMEIAKAHGGTINVESRLGEGAAFTLEIPLPPRESDSVDVARPAQQTTAGTSTSAVSDGVGDS